MPGISKIGWTEKTWNPVTGCDKVSPGCAHCYAETFAERWRGIPGHPYEHGFDVPLRWRKPAMIFVNSMSDLFHEDIPFEYIAAVFGVMGNARQHTFQVLTKRPDRTADFFAWYAAQCRENELIDPDEQAMFGVGCARDLDIDGLELLDGAGDAWPLRNVWLGVSIENRRFVGRADVLRQVPAAVRFISAEPLLGPLVSDRHQYECECNYEGQPSPHVCCSECGDDWPCRCPPDLDLTGIDWLIAGGESGPGHRPIQVEWVRDLRDACLATRPRDHGLCQNCARDMGDCTCGYQGTAFFFKQVGGARPTSGGRELDGRTWDEMPAAATLKTTS